MGFRNEADKVRNDALPRGLRYRCLLSCMERYCWLTRAGFRRTCADLDRRVGFRFGAENDGETLSAALREICAAREAFLLTLERFAHARARAKAKGRRQPSKRELERLYGSVSLGAG